MSQLIFPQRICELIHERAPNKLTAAELCQELNVSKSHLQHEFKAKTGLTISQYTSHVAMGLAAEAIATSDRRILDIALDFGFESQEAFCRAFKRRFGLSPKNLRDRSEMARHLSSGCIDIKYLQLFQHFTSSPPTRQEMPELVLHGIVHSFPSIQLGESEFYPHLEGMWQEFAEATAHWRDRPRSFYTLEYRNMCSTSNGHFQMVAACDGELEPTEATFSQVVLPARSVWRFVLPAVDYVRAFFVYLYSVFTLEHNLVIARLPIVWQLLENGTLECFVELRERGHTLPSAIVSLSSTLIRTKPQSGLRLTCQVPTHLAQRGQRFRYILSSLYQEFTHITQRGGAILFGAQGDSVRPEHDYEVHVWQPLPFTNKSELAEEDVTEHWEKSLPLPFLSKDSHFQVSEASYIECELYGSIEEISDALDYLYLSDVGEFPFRLTAGFHWLVALSRDSEHAWRITLRLPALKR